MRSFDRVQFMTPEAQLVLLIARWVVNGQGKEASAINSLLTQEALQWASVNDLLVYHALFPFVYSCFKNCSSLIPPDEIALLKKNQDFALIFLACLEKEFSKIADILRSNNVELLPIKGMGFFIDKMYGDMSCLRPMTDIDILIKEHKLKQAAILLKELGYEQEFDGKREEYWKEQSYHLIFKKREEKKLYKLEVHWLLDYPGRISLLPSLWQRIRKCRWGGKETSLLSWEDTLFCLALHLRRYGNVLSLKSACDVALLLSKYKELDWDYILKEAGAGRLRSSLYFVLSQAELLFNVKAPLEVLKNLGLPAYKKHLIQDFILRNTFWEGLSLHSQNSNRANLIYLNSHFLVYDDFLKPVTMIINMPQEQFAKLYSLPTYYLRTRILYKLRSFYFLFEFLKLIFKTSAKKVAKWITKYVT